jgi:hypothetical protein
MTVAYKGFHLWRVHRLIVAGTSGDRALVSFRHWADAFAFLDRYAEGDNRLTVLP